MPLNLYKRVFTNTTTANSYVDSQIVDVLEYSSIFFSIKNAGDTNSIAYKILGSAKCSQAIGSEDPYDPNAPWHEIVSEQTLAKSTSAVQTSTAAYGSVKIQVKSATANSPSQVYAWVIAKR
jgi:predicted restriction endonuclease